MKNKLKILALILCLVIVACKNENTFINSSVEDEENNIELQRLTDNQIASIALTLNKVNSTYLDVGMEKTQNEEVKIFTDNAKKKIEELYNKTESLMSDYGFRPEANDLDREIVDDLRRQTRMLKDADMDNFETWYMETMKDYLKKGKNIFEKSIDQIDNEPRLLEVINANLETYRTLLKKAQEVEKEINPQI